MEIDDKRNRYTLSTGKTFYAYCGIIGLSPNYYMYEGYDDSLEDGIINNEAGRVEDFTCSEKIEIADMMIERWKHFKNIAKNEEEGE